MIRAGIIKESLLNMQFALFTVYLHDYSLWMKKNCLLGIADGLYYQLKEINKVVLNSALKTIRSAEN